MLKLTVRHVLIPLMSSVGFSPGKKKVAASTSFIFPEKHGHEPKIIHEDWDYNMHLMKFKKTTEKRRDLSFCFGRFYPFLSSKQRSAQRGRALDPFC